MIQIKFHLFITKIYDIINLLVEPHTEILGGADMHVDWGSTINLTCVSKFSPVPPLDVIWYHNNKVIYFIQKNIAFSFAFEMMDRTIGFNPRYSFLFFRKLGLTLLAGV